MDTWIWLVILGAAVVLFALAWWSSGRTRARGRGPETSLTDKQSESVHYNSMWVRGRGGFGGGSS